MLTIFTVLFDQYALLHAFTPQNYFAPIIKAVSLFNYLFHFSFKQYRFFKRLLYLCRAFNSASVYCFAIMQIYNISEL